MKFLLPRRNITNKAQITVKTICLKMFDAGSVGGQY